MIKWVVDDSQLQKTTGRAKDAQKATDDLRKSTKSYGDDVKTATAAGMNGFGDLKSIISSISLVTLVASLGSVAKKIFDIGVANQQTKISFEVMLGSAEKAKKVLAELTKFSIVTPFTPDQVNKAAKALLAFDVEANKLIPTLKFLGDVSSGTGKDLTEMAIIFGQIRSTGRLMGQDLLQLINAGFNPLQVISKETGKSVGQLKQEMEKGLVTFDMVEKAFISATSEGGRFFDLMNRQSTTIGGQLSTIEGNVEEIAKGLFEAREGGLASFIEGIAKLTSNIEGSTKVINTWLDLITTAPAATLNIFSFFADEAEKAANTTRRLRREQLVLELELAKGELDAQAKTGFGGQQRRLEIIQQIFDLEKRLGLVKIIDIEEPLEVIKDPEKQIGLVEALQKKIKELGEDIVHTADKGDLGSTGKLVIQLRQAQAQLDILLGKHKDKRKKDANEVQEYLAYLSDLEMFQTKEMLKDGIDARQTSAEKQAEIDQTSFEHWKYYDDLKRQKQKETEEEAIEIAEDAAAKKRRIDQETFDLTLDLLRSAAEFALTSRNNEVQQVSDYYDQQMDLAGENERARKSLQMDKDRDLERARLRQKKADQKSAETKILIDGLIAIAKIFGDFGWPAGIVPAGIMAGITAVNVAQVRKYKKGEISIKGPGSETSDSIPAMLSAGESVMTADETRKSFGILTDIRTGKLNDKILKQITVNGGSQSLDDSRIVHILQKIESKRSPDLVRQGKMIFEVYKDRDGNKKKIRSKSI